jgi:hypothetical protein
MSNGSPHYPPSTVSLWAPMIFRWQGVADSIRRAKQTGKTLSILLSLPHRPKSYLECPPFNEAISPLPTASRTCYYDCRRYFCARRGFEGQTPRTHLNLDHVICVSGVADSALHAAGPGICYLLRIENLFSKNPLVIAYFGNCSRVCAVLAMRTRLMNSVRYPNSSLPFADCARSITS